MNRFLTIIILIFITHVVVMASTPTDSTGNITNPTDSTTRLPSHRKVTPIRNTDDLSSKPILHYYDRHGKPLEEPVAIWVEEDTVKVIRRPNAPLFNGFTAGLNFFDAILQLAGQSYGNYNLSFAVNLHNWFLPTIELGMGYANNKPNGKNYHYKSNPSLFTRIGLDYNFLYNSTPDYKALFGLRLGYSNFGYEVTGISFPGNYWNPEPVYATMQKQKASAIWGEVLAGLQVKIIDAWSMGWSVRYKFKLHTSDGKNSSPWFIPGFGGRNAPLSATFSVYYTLGHQNKQKKTTD